MNGHKPRISPENDCHFAGSVFKWIFLNENYSILIQISLKFVPTDRIESKSLLVQISA